MSESKICFSSSKKWIGKQYLYFPQIPSTNQWLKENSNFPCGTIVFTSFQTKGKGRFSKVWQHTPGNLAFSILIKKEAWIYKYPVTLLLGLALRRFFIHKLAIEAQIKWPNDILIKSRKIAGILCESTVHAKETNLICGVGVNLTRQLPLESYHPIGLEEVLERSIFPFTFLEEILDEIESVFLQTEAGNLEALIEEWNQTSGMKNKSIRYFDKDRQYDAIVSHVNQKGELVVQNLEQNKLVCLCSHEISLTSLWQ